MYIRNNNMKKYDQGFSHILAIVFILVLIGAVGYMAWQAFTQTAKAPDSSESTKNTDSEQAAKLAWQYGDTAVAGLYADADVVKLDNGNYRMYYADQPPMNPSAGPAELGVWSSISSDGITWKKESGKRMSNVTFPEVVHLKNGKWRMYYQSSQRIKSAISSDGLNFTEESGDRIAYANSAGLDLTNVAAPAVFQLDNGTFVMVYRGSLDGKYSVHSPNQDTNLLLWASSQDGLKFTSKGIAVDSRNDTLLGSLDGPNLVKWDDGTYRLFSTSYTGVYSFAFDGGKFGEPVLEFAGDAKRQGDQLLGQPPGDPTLIRIGDTWYMYYGQTGDATGIHYATLK